MFYTVSENSNKLLIEISREDSTLDLENFEVLITTAQTKNNEIDTYNKYHKQKQLNEIIDTYQKNLLSQTYNDFHGKKELSNKNLTLAKPNEDYLAINEIVKFASGEIFKVN